MENAAASPDTLDGATLRRRVLERVRYEQSLGVDFVPRVAFSFAPAAAPVPVATRSATPTVTIPSTPSRPAVTPPARVPAPIPVQKAGPTLDLVTHSGDKESRWKALEAQALGCVKCVLHQARTNVVFGTGNRNAKLVFVGEGPGQDEDLQGEPFVGKAGQLLNKIIAAMKLTREEVYICNVVKCRPPGNRTPLPDEIAACSPFLAEQLELVAPQVIVALGGPAAKTLLRTETGITALRGRWHSYKTIPVMPTFHPAFVLRTYTEEVRRQVWEDMKKVMAKLQ